MTRWSCSIVWPSMLRRLRVQGTTGHESWRSYCKLTVPTIDSLLQKFETLVDQKALKEKPYFFIPPKTLVPHSRNNEQQRDGFNEAKIDTKTTAPQGEAGSDSEKKENDGPTMVESKEAVALSMRTRNNEILHPWPEWIDLMERLAKQNYFQFKPTDVPLDTRMIKSIEAAVGYESALAEFHGDGKNVATSDDPNYFLNHSAVRRACVEFGLYRFDLLRYFTQKDIYMLVGFGCPTNDKKVILSAKRLRKYVRLDEGEVCSKCKLRDICSIPYIVDTDLAETADVMRVLSEYGLDPLLDIVKNKLHKIKTVKAAIRNLIGEIVTMSAFPLDPNLRKPLVKTRVQKKTKKKNRDKTPSYLLIRTGHVKRDVKLGDWHCPVCDFNNFSKHCTCLNCETPGEWQCPECKFQNYKGHVKCYKCRYQRTS